MITDVKAIEQELQRRLSPELRNPKNSDGFIDKVQAADQFTMSVQSSQFHYCIPRDSRGPWVEVEVGFPSDRVEKLMPYINGRDEDPTKTFYGYVPIRLVAEVLAERGGLVEELP